jgi:hypothetical protein
MTIAGMTMHNGRAPNWRPENRMDRKLAMTLAVALLAANNATAAPDMKSGLWEITVANQITGVPMIAPAITMRQCFRPEDMRDPQRLLPRLQDPATKCDTLDYKEYQNTATWRLDCIREGNTVSGNGTIAMRSDSYDATTTLEMKAGGSTIRMSQKMSGKWMGECGK